MEELDASRSKSPIMKQSSDKPVIVLTKIEDQYNFQDQSQQVLPQNPESLNVLSNSEVDISSSPGGSSAAIKTMIENNQVELGVINEETSMSHSSYHSFIKQSKGSLSRSQNKQDTTDQNEPTSTIREKPK